MLQVFFLLMLEIWFSLYESEKHYFGPCLGYLSQKLALKCLKIIINEHTISLIIREEQIAKPQFFIPVWLWHVFHDPLSMMPHTVRLRVHLQTILEE